MRAPHGWWGGLPMRKWVGTRIGHEHCIALQWSTSVSCSACLMPGVLASLVLHWQAAHLHKHNAALTWQKSWPCNPHPSLPACIHACHKIKSSNWMSIGPHVVQVQTNQHRRKQWFAFCQFEAEEEDSHSSYRGEPMTQETTKKISFG